jgi:Hypoxia induced protein conserved region
MDPLQVIIILALIATVVALALGLLAMSGGGATDREFSTKLMWSRVTAQVLTIVLLIVATFLR